MRYWWALAIAIVTGCSGDSIERLNFVATNNAMEELDVAIQLEHIGPQAISKYDLSDAGCSVSTDNGERLLFISRMEDAHFLLEGDLQALVPRPGTATLPYGVSTHYDGLAYSAEITIDNDSERLVDLETSDWVGRLIIRDTEERIVFKYSGTVRCGA